MDYEHNTADASAAAPVLQRYMPEVEAQFESEEAALEFLRTLYNIMCTFVDIGWGVDSIHFVFPGLAEISSSESEGAVSCPEHQTIKDDVEAAFAEQPSLGDS